MDGPADDVVSPCLVVVAVWFLREDSNAFLGAVPLGIWACAPLLGATAELFDRLLDDLRIRKINAQTSDNPIVEIGNPSVVLENRSAVVKLPKCYLEREVSDAIT
jgi:hypothetical protein